MCGYGCLVLSGYKGDFFRVRLFLLGLFLGWSRRFIFWITGGFVYPVCGGRPLFWTVVSGRVGCRWGCVLFAVVEREFLPGLGVLLPLWPVAFWGGGRVYSGLWGAALSAVISILCDGVLFGVC